VAERVGIVGVGYEGFRPAITDLSTREMMYQAASKAYAEAGVDPRTDVGSFICCTEDFWEGWSITDEMVPDQIGGARRPLCTVPGDGIIGIGHAVMHIRSGVADVVAVEAHSKTADVGDKVAVENLALDPAFQRVTGVNSDVLAGLEMSMFMGKAGVSREALSRVIMAEKRRALRNERASYGGVFELAEISEAEPMADPLRRFDRAEFADAGVVIVLASEKWIKRKKMKDAVFIDGVAWRSATPWFEGGGVAQADYASACFKSVMKQCGLRSVSAFDVLEIDDTYSFKLVQHLMSIGLTKLAAMKLALDETRVNPSGGSLGVGHLIEANGLHKVLECVLQMRGRAGGSQVKRPKRALAFSWRGNPTSTGAAVALSRGRRP
jgi:acetyl-CoA C-acetyltransferase